MSWVFAPPAASTAHRPSTGKVTRFSQFRAARRHLRSGVDWLLRRPGTAAATPRTSGAPRLTTFQGLAGDGTNAELLAARGRLRSPSVGPTRPRKKAPPVPPRAPGTFLVSGSAPRGAGPMSLTPARSISGLVLGETVLSPESIVALAEHMARAGLLIAPAQNSQGLDTTDSFRLAQLERSMCFILLSPA